MNHCIHFAKITLVLVTMVALVASTAVADDELEKRASWEAPTAAMVKEQIEKWLADKKVDEVTKFKIETLWPAENRPATSSQLLERLAVTFALVNESARPVVGLCSGVRTDPSAPKFDLLKDEKAPAFVRNNLRLYYGRWLAQHDLYDEALEQLDGLKPAEVVDPASLLFYQGVGYHRLLKKDKCLPILTQLLENEDAIPRRYETVASLMVADLKPLKPDSLDEIARLMEDIRRRQKLYRSGKRVRKEEEDVLAKLDKLIEELEKQQQQGGGGSGSGKPKGGSQSSSPAQDSAELGGKGPGNVDKKKLRLDDNWGDLPEKEREAIVQDLSKDLPAHYREVIKEYFRRLAQDEPR